MRVSLEEGGVMIFTKIDTNRLLQDQVLYYQTKANLLEASLKDLKDLLEYQELAANTLNMLESSYWYLIYGNTDHDKYRYKAAEIIQTAIDKYRTDYVHYGINKHININTDVNNT
jgi:hypothetical protein